VGSWDSVQSLFLDHVRSSFLDDFVAEQVRTSVDNPEHFVANAASQGSFSLINTSSFEYSVRVLAGFHRRAHYIKWLGMRQVIAVKGSGTVVIRILRVPPELDIEQFVANVPIREYDVREARHGDVVASEDENEILDILEVSPATVTEILTYRYMAPSVIWTFTPELISVYAEQSSLNASRFRYVLRLAQAEGLSVPDDIYDLALNSNSPQVALLAIQSMLSTGHPESFSKLQHALESNHDSVRRGAAKLMDAAFIGRTVQ
jgi:hypothetical protein